MEIKVSDMRFETHPMIGDQSGTVHVLRIEGTTRPLATICEYDDGIARLIVAALNVINSENTLRAAMDAVSERTVTPGQTKDDEANK